MKIVKQNDYNNYPIGHKEGLQFSVLTLQSYSRATTSILVPCPETPLSLYEKHIQDETLTERHPAPVKTENSSGTPVEPIRLMSPVIFLAANSSAN